MSYILYMLVVTFLTVVVGTPIYRVVCYKNRNGFVGVKKRNNKIEMIPYITTTINVSKLKRMFIKDLINFEKELEPDEVYTIVTHTKILEHIQSRIEKKNNIEIISGPIKKKKRLLYENVFVLDFRGALTEEVQFYEIKIRKINKNT